MVQIRVKNSNIIKGRSALAEAIHKLDGNYMVEFICLDDPNTVEDYRKLYFYLRDIIWASTDTGYTKAELHEELKQVLFPKLPGGSFADASSKMSTSNLTLWGWKNLIKELKEFAKEFWELVI